MLKNNVSVVECKIRDKMRQTHSCIYFPFHISLAAVVAMLYCYNKIGAIFGLWYPEPERLKSSALMSSLQHIHKAIRCQSLINFAASGECWLGLQAILFIRRNYLGAFKDRKSQNVVKAALMFFLLLLCTSYGQPSWSYAQIITTWLLIIPRFPCTCQNQCRHSLQL